MAKKKSQLWCQTLLQSWLDERQWQDELDVNKDEREATLHASIDIKGQSFKLIVIAEDETEWVTVSIYFPFKVKPEKRQQMFELLCELNLRTNIGSWLIFEDSLLAYWHRVHFRGSSPTATSVEVMVGAGWSWCEEYEELISTVALTKQSAKDAIAEFDAQKQKDKESSSKEDVPDTL